MGAGGVPADFVHTVSFAYVGDGEVRRGREVQGRPGRIVRYGHLVWYALIIAAVYGFVRPGTAAGKGVTAVTDSLSSVIGQGLGVAL